MDEDLLISAILIQLPLICFINWLMIKEIYIICFKKDEIYFNLEIELKNIKQKKYFIIWTILINLDLVVFVFLIKYSILPLIGAMCCFIIISIIFAINTNILKSKHK
jgi:hypothetical protein